jgi:DNA recombination protein RmuC
LESRVLVTARRFSELELVTDQLSSPDQVECSPRSVQAVELVASAAHSLIALDPPPREQDSAQTDVATIGADWAWMAEHLHRGPGDNPEASSVNG